MATLLEKLQQTLSGAAAPEQTVDETGQVRQLLAAKKGIVGPETALGPRGLAVSEIAARAPAQQQLAQVAQSAQLQGIGLQQAAAGQEMEQRQREEELAAQKQSSRLENRIQTENLLRNLEQGKATLSEQQRQLGLEAVASSLRLQDARYVDNLQREGAKARLQDDIAFTEKLQQSILDDNLALQKLKYKNESAINASDRDFTKALAKIDITMAVAMARDNAQADIQKATIQGYASIPMVGAQAYGAYKSGSLSGDYQDYAEKERVAGRYPMSYTSWMTKQETDAAKGNLPATGYTGGVSS